MFISVYLVLFVVTAFFLTLSLVTAFRIPLSKPSRIFYASLLILLFPALVLMLVAYHFTGDFADDAVFYHLFYGVEGAGLIEYWPLMLVSLLILMVIVALAFLLIKKPIRSHSNWWFVVKPLPFISLLIVLIVNPTTASSYAFYKRQFSALDSFQMAEMSAEFQQYYRQAAIQRVKSQAKKNLVLIYAESLERTYFDDALFPDLMPELKKLENQAISFTNIVELPNTGWTIAGLVATHCGLPLVTPSGGNTMQGMDAFYPKAICLSDALKQQGYSNHYLAGGDTTFAGKQSFLRSHAYQTIEGKKSLLPNLDDPRYLSAWGLYDDSTLAFFYQRFEQLSKQSEPFVLTTLTLDTHNPHGHESAACKTTQYGDGSKAILNAVHCADWQLAALIKKIQSSNYADNTVIVLLSDHLAQHDNGVIDILSQGDRRNLWMIFPPQLKQGRQIDELGSTLDMASTLLPFIGFSGEVGLGKNLLATDANQQQAIATIHKKLHSWWPMVASFWQFPAADKGIAVKPDKQQIIIAKQKIQMPVLLELDAELTAIPYFEQDQVWHQANLADRFYRGSEQLMVLLDYCNNVAKFTLMNHRDEFCLLIGKDRQILLEQSLTDNTFLSAEQLRQWSMQ